MKSPRNNPALGFRALNWLLLASFLGLAGCANPISAQRVSSRQSYVQSTASALSGDHYSGSASLVLHRYGLEDRFKKSPAETLKLLHEKACTDDRRDLLYALAELNYLYAGQRLRVVKPWAPKDASDYYLSSAIYAYLYLFENGGEAAEDLFDPRSRLACDLYNRAVAKGFATGNVTNSAVLLEGGQRHLPPGALDVRFVHPRFPFDLTRIDHFLPADDFVVHGLSEHNRHFGLGAALMGIEKPTGDSPLVRHIPATIFLRVSGGVKEWSSGTASASLELYSAHDNGSVDVAGREIPLETDLTTPFAHTLNSEGLWTLGRTQFFSPVEKIKSGVYTTQPHRPGRIPVVFVHGTFSSPVWWAEMWNTLRADPVLAEHFELWYYIYNSGNAAAYSAANFRDALTNIVHQLDPNQQDSAMQQMVLIGHSQGGLLAKMAVTDSGDKLWHALSDRNVDDLKLTAAQHSAIKRCLFFKPLPFVKRVVFISTPHRGSFRIGFFLLRLAAWLVSLPLDTAHTMGGIFQENNDLRLPRELRHGVPNSLDSMSPNNKVQLTLAEIPPAPGVKCNSIIAIKGDGDPKEGNDGIVDYQSAHVDYAESEFIVRSTHSCQDKPATIEEVRRILLEHIRSLPTTIKAERNDTVP